MTTSQVIIAGVDFVLFANGTYWGDDQSSTLSHIRENAAARSATRRTILDQLNTKSADEVKADLKRELEDAREDKYSKARKVNTFPHYSDK